MANANRRQPFTRTGEHVRWIGEAMVSRFPLPAISAAKGWSKMRLK
jgi:hypothetical protein